MASSVVNELRQIGERLARIEATQARIETAILEIQGGQFDAGALSLSGEPVDTSAIRINMPPEVEAAIAVRFSGDIAAAQQTRTVALSRLQHGVSPEKVRDEVLRLGEVVE